MLGISEGECGAYLERIMAFGTTASSDGDHNQDEDSSTRVKMAYESDSVHKAEHIDFSPG